VPLAPLGICVPAELQAALADEPFPDLVVEVHLRDSIRRLEKAG
jgi:hypothetical protein